MAASILTPRRAVAAAFALNGAMLGTWASRVPAIAERFDLGEGGLGLLFLMMGLGALVAFPFAGKAADRAGAARVTRVLTVGLLVAVVFLSLAPSTILLGAAILCFGVVYGGMDVTMNSWAAEVEQHVGRPIMASFHAMWSFGAGAGAAIGFLAVRADLSYTAQFILSALALALLLGPFIATPWSSRQSEPDTGGPVFALPRGPLFLVGIVALSAGLGEGAMADWSAVFLHDVVGTDQSRAALGYAVYSVTMVAMRLCVDSLVERLGPTAVARVGGLAAAVGLALVAGIATFPAALLGFVLMGIGYAAIIPLAFSRAAADPHVPPGQGIAAVATFAYGAVLLGPPSIGFIAEVFSLRLAFLVLGAFAILIAVFAPVLRRAERGTTEQPTFEV